jgi:hypothetical protein
LLKRRQILQGLSASVLAPAGAAWADASALTLMVAGPEGQQTSRWGNALALAMAPGFPGAPALLTQADGGLDGVTGANRLDALVMPDGKTAAILPGAALIAWLTNDSRVHFDPTRWLPVLGGMNSGVLVARLAPGASPDLQTLRQMAPLRLAVSTPQSNDLAALLALGRLRVPTAPVFDLRGADARTSAFAAGQVDAVFVCGENVPEDIAPLVANGGAAFFSLGVETESGQIGPDPLFPNVPDAIAFGGAARSPLDNAYYAAAAAARLDFLMVLPKLSDPGGLALWRQAGEVGMAAPALAAAADASAISLGGAPVVQAALTAMNLAQKDQSNLLAFLEQRFGWQPG